MLLEHYIDQGILMQQLFRASQNSTITFADGMVRVTKKNGTYSEFKGVMTLVNIETAIEMVEGEQGNPG